MPLIVAGDSAGGNLAAVMALRARDRGGPPIALQVLIYPVTDADFDRPSYVDAENQLLLTRDAMVWFWDHYVPDAARRAEPDASPLQAADLAGLPPAVVLTAEHDVLRDEGEAYAERAARGRRPGRLPPPRRPDARLLHAPDAARQRARLPAGRQGRAAPAPSAHAQGRRGSPLNDTRRPTTIETTVETPA